MAGKGFEVGDLVWAKMKSYPYWPARVVDPPNHIKPPNIKKGKYCVCFFGTNDFAWIPEDCIVPHTEERALSTKNKTKTSAALLKAIKEILDYNDKSPDKSTFFDPESENEDNKNDVSENDASENDASSEMSPTSPAKVEKKTKKREKHKKKLNYESSSSDSARSSLDRETDTEVSLPSDIMDISFGDTPPKEELTNEKEPKVQKKCNLTKSSSNESIAVSIEEDKNSEDLFKSASSDNDEDAEKDDLVSTDNLFIMNSSATSSEAEEEEKMKIKKYCPRKNNKRKLEFPEDYNIKRTDLGPPNRHFYSCPPTPEIQMNSSGYLGDKEIKATDKKIGFLGINKMSAGIVKNLLLSGHNLTVWSDNLEKCEPFIEAGASIAETADDVVASCDITFGYLADVNAVKCLMYGNFGILKGLEGCSKGSKGYVEMTPIDLTTALEFKKAFSFYETKYIIAPVVGSRQIADEGSVLCLAAGDVELFTDCYSCFSSFSRNVFYVSGDLEDGVKMYLIQSMLIGTTTAALAEAMALIKKCNLSFDSFYELIEMGPFSCQLALEKSNLMNSRNFLPNSILNHQLVDMKMALKLANSHQQSSVVSAAAHELFKRAKLLNYSDHDVSSVVMGTEIDLDNSFD